MIIVFFSTEGNKFKIVLGFLEYFTLYNVVCVKYELSSSQKEFFCSEKLEQKKCLALISIDESFIIVNQG